MSTAPIDFVSELIAAEGRMMETGGKLSFVDLVSELIAAEGAIDYRSDGITLCVPCGRRDVRLTLLAAREALAGRDARYDLDDLDARIRITEAHLRACQIRHGRLPECADCWIDYAALHPRVADRCARCGRCRVHGACAGHTRED